MQRPTRAARPVRGAGLRASFLMQAGLPVEDLTRQTQVVKKYNRARANTLSTGHLQYPDSDHHAMCDFDVEPGGRLGFGRLPVVRVHFVLYI